MRTTLSVTASTGSLQCPICGLFSTLQPSSRALRQLSCHFSSKHKGYPVKGRWCCGPSHSAPVWLTIDRFPSEGPNRPWRRSCLDCMKYKRRQKLGTNTGWIEAKKLRPFVLQARNRYGSLEQAALAANVSVSWIYNIAGGKTKYAERATAAKLLRALR